MDEVETRVRRQLEELEKQHIETQHTNTTTNTTTTGHHEPHLHQHQQQKQQTQTTQQQHHTAKSHTHETIHCPLLANFVATHHTHQAQDKARPPNRQHLLELVAQHPRELPTHHSVDVLVRYHQSLVDARAPHAHARLALEALNTLEALRAHPPAHALFEQLCAPSSSDKACRIHAEYVGYAFAKRALLRSALGDDAEASLGGGGDLDAGGLLQDPRFHFAAIVLIASAAWLALQAIHGLA